MGWAGLHSQAPTPTRKPPSPRPPCPAQSLARCSSVWDPGPRGRRQPTSIRNMRDSSPLAGQINNLEALATVLAWSSPERLEDTSRRRFGGGSRSGRRRPDSGEAVQRARADQAARRPGREQQRIYFYFRLSTVWLCHFLKQMCIWREIDADNVWKIKRALMLATIT